MASFGSKLKKQTCLGRLKSGLLCQNLRTNIVIGGEKSYFTRASYDNELPLFCAECGEIVAQQATKQGV